MRVLTRGIVSCFHRSKLQPPLESCRWNTSGASVAMLPQSNNDIEITSIRNRNPRNLEKLRIAEKPSGWDFEKHGQCFWNKLCLEITGRHVTGKIVHFEGMTPITASTKETCISKNLYSTKDISAVRAVGEVLAERCIRSGLTEVACFFEQEELEKEKIIVFLDALRNRGIAIEESNQMNVHWSRRHYTEDEKSWKVQDSKN